MRVTATAFITLLVTCHARSQVPTRRRLVSVRGGAKTDAPAAPPALKPSSVAINVAVATIPTLARFSMAAVSSRGTSLPIPERWQVALAMFWAANMIAVGVPGRYDSQTVAAKEKEIKTTALTANLFSPSGWAFIIWAPIFIGEAAMMLLLTNAQFFQSILASWTGAGASTGTVDLLTLGRAVAPGWCAGIAAQVAWCGAFRPSVCGPATLWIPALLLACTGLGLGVAHRCLRDLDGSLPGLSNALVRWPIVLHLGWITAASLVNLNNWLARRGTSVGIKAAVAKASVAVALAAAVYVWRTTGDALFAFVVCWALSAVASDGNKNARGVVDKDVLESVQGTIGTGAAVAFIALLIKIGQ